MKLDKRLRCYVKQQANNVWRAVCVDLNLSTQAASGQEAIDKLHWLIKRYACAFKALPHALPVALLVYYYWIKFLAKPYAFNEEPKAYFFITQFPIPPLNE